MGRRVDVSEGGWGNERGCASFRGAMDLSADAGGILRDGGISIGRRAVSGCGILLFVDGGGTLREGGISMGLRGDSGTLFVGGAEKERGEPSFRPEGISIGLRPVSVGGGGEKERGGPSLRAGGISMGRACTLLDCVAEKERGGPSVRADGISMGRRPGSDKLFGGGGVKEREGPSLLLFRIERGGDCMFCGCIARGGFAFLLIDGPSLRRVSGADGGFICPTAAK